MSYVSAAPQDLAAQARALGQSEEAAAEDRKHTADRTASDKLRRFAAMYVMTLSSAIFVASAFVFDLTGADMGQPSGQRSAVVAAGMTGASDATATAMTIEVVGFTVSIPMRDTSL